MNRCMGEHFVLHHLHTSAWCVCKQLSATLGSLGYTHKISGCLLRVEFRFMGRLCQIFQLEGAHFWLVDQDYQTSLQLMSARFAIECPVPKMGQSHAYTLRTVIMCNLIKYIRLHNHTDAITGMEIERFNKKIWARYAQ